MYIRDIINFSKEISISHISQYLKGKTEEKVSLESSIQNLNQKIIQLSNLKKEKEKNNDYHQLNKNWTNIINYFL